MTDTAAGTANAARFWDRMARRYAASPIRDMAGYERTVESTRALLKPTDRVLEIGCGTGTTALKLAPSVAEIVATDVSPAMLAIARDKAAAQACGNVRFVEAPAAGPFESRCATEPAFDAVLAFNVLHLLMDRGAVYDVIRRRLKPGGLFISKTPCLAEMNWLIGLAIPVARAIRLAPDVAVFTGAQVEAEIAAAGFRVIERARHGSGPRDPRLVLVATAP
jgi:SAM-dependent methyltransferase